MDITEKAKIRNVKGKILTVVIDNKTSTHIYGRDKFNQLVIIPIVEIDSMLPVSGDDL